MLFMMGCLLLAGLPLLNIGELDSKVKGNLRLHEQKCKFWWCGACTGRRYVSMGRL